MAFIPLEDRNGNVLFTAIVSEQDAEHVFKSTNGTTLKKNTQWVG